MSKELNIKSNPFNGPLSRTTWYQKKTVTHSLYTMSLINSVHLLLSLHPHCALVTSDNTFLQPHDKLSLGDPRFNIRHLVLHTLFHPIILIPSWNMSVQSYFAVTL